MPNYKNISVLDVPASTDVDVIATAEAILKASDWTQLPDSGLTDACVALFATYRASIRTIRKTNPASPTWPDAPTEEWS
jgi:hypothetical protein